MAFSHKHLGNVNGIGSCHVYSCLVEACMFRLSCVTHTVDALGTRECHALLIYFICYSEQHDPFRKLNLLRVQVKRMESTCPLLPVRHSITKLRRRSSGTKKKKRYVRTY